MFHRFTRDLNEETLPTGGHVATDCGRPSFGDQELPELEGKCERGRESERGDEKSPLMNLFSTFFDH